MNGTNGTIKNNSWEEEDKVVEACAATILYRKRRNARLLPSTPKLAALMKTNQLCRLQQMMRQLIPAEGLRPGRGDENVFDPDEFEIFIYNPFRDSSQRRYRLYRDISKGAEVFPVQVFSDTEDYSKPEPFEYIQSNDYSLYKRDALSKREKPLFKVRCDCVDLICGDDCACRLMNDSLTVCTITGDGRVFHNSDATFFNMLIVGCGKKCACKGQCRNTLTATSLPAPFKFEVFRRNDEVGFGLRTLSNIPQGCAVVEFCGEILDEKQMALRGAESINYAFCLQSYEENEMFQRLAAVRNVKCEAFSAWDNVAFIDPKRKGNIARFISHGCFPNLIMLRYAENDLRLSRSRAVLFASQPILGGSELFFDYGNQYLSRAGFSCQCGTMWCDSVRKLWRSPFPTQEEMTRKALAYFAYIEERISDYDVRAKKFLRGIGKIKPEYDDLDEVATVIHGSPSSVSRIDPACVHKRDGEEMPVICYNFYCKNLEKCTCKALQNVVTTITLE
ncbi:unnamed protein product [Cylicocyclus nassatus]|uniref:SET domain-containing protein n=1 Tax=Cylicocyclus nassatus TaxID=53992 RepID=A0AA36GJI2_CYLNA|nr:unnamed protein product [Cylicocyclus nassatus]